MVYYNITKKDGERYYCSINSESNVLKVFVRPDKDFNFVPSEWYGCSSDSGDKAGSADYINGQFLGDGLGQIKFMNAKACYYVDDGLGGDYPVCINPAVNIMCNAVK